MQGLRARICALAAQRLRGLAPAGGKKRVVDKGPAKVGELSTTVATGVALRKGEADPPLRPDSEYPPWLFQLLEPEPTTAELQRLYEKGEGLTLAQMKRLFRYSNKQRIREQNELRAKK